MQPLQDTPPDVASSHHGQGDGQREKVLISPLTVGVLIKGAMKGSSQLLPEKKARKRPGRKELAAKQAADASSSKSVPPTGFADRVQMKGTTLIHVSGKP